jgi:hypothetical protein
MVDVMFDDVRRMVLGLLFVVAFGWMAAELVPGGHEAMPPLQIALGGDVIPPHP